MALSFYDIDKDYVKYLQKEEMNERDFTKVPNIEYPGNLSKFTCGVVLDVHEYKYYVPVSSYKMQKPDNILINIESERYNKVKGALRFNYMFPVPDECIKERIIVQIPLHRITDSASNGSVFPVVTEHFSASSDHAFL